MSPTIAYLFRIASRLTTNGPSLSFSLSLSLSRSLSLPLSPHLYIYIYIICVHVSVYAADNENHRRPNSHPSTKHPHEQQGLVTGPAFTVVYTLSGIPLSWLADRWSRVYVVLIGLGVWTAVTMCIAFAQEFYQAYTLFLLLFHPQFLLFLLLLLLHHIYAALEAEKRHELRKHRFTFSPQSCLTSCPTLLPPLSPPLVSSISFTPTHLLPKSPSFFCSV